MKICPRCNRQLDDSVAFCTGCGAKFESATVQTVQYTYDQYDHTNEFDKKDVSGNKVIAMLVYLLGPIGIIIALLASNTSPFAAYHVRQALKFTVVEILSLIAFLIVTTVTGFFFTVLSPQFGIIWMSFIGFIYGIYSLFLVVLKFICFFQICSGKSKEPVFIRNLNFLR